MLSDKKNVKGVRQNTYYKHPWDDPGVYMSGCHLPDPKGSYKFIKCTFHPGLTEVLAELYQDSEFIDCE